jgi:hypothetical protein
MKKGYRNSLIGLVALFMIAIQSVEGRCSLTISNSIVFTPATYSFKYFPGPTILSANSQTAIRFKFPIDSGIQVSSIPTCYPDDFTSFNVVNG